MFQSLRRRDSSSTSATDCDPKDLPPDRQVPPWPFWDRQAPAWLFQEGRMIIRPYYLLIRRFHN